MSEKTILRQLRDVYQKERELQSEIVDEIKKIFKEISNGALDEVEFYDPVEIWIYLNKGVSISTELFDRLNDYFHAEGKLSYSTGDGFVVVYRW